MKRENSVYDSDIKDLVLKHDIHIDMLATSIEQLATGVGSTNKKLDDVIDVIQQQNVLAERITNIDKESSESFIRAWKRLDKIEDVLSTNGCEIAKSLNTEKDTIYEKLVVSKNRIKDLESTVKDIESEYVTKPTIKWGLIIILTYIISFGAYVVVSLHEVDNRAVKCETILGLTKGNK